MQEKDSSGEEVRILDWPCIKLRGQNRSLFVTMYPINTIVRSPENDPAQTHTLTRERSETYLMRISQHFAETLIELGFPEDTSPMDDEALDEINRLSPED